MAVPIRGHAARTVICENCATEFVHYQSRAQRFCSLRCGATHRYKTNPVVRMTAREVFEHRVRPRLVADPSGCLLWSGARNDRGYGQTTVDRRRRYVHRLAWEYHHGEVPAGLLVLHHCDTPHCANHEHLFIGTQSDNMRDCAAKGRLGQQRHLNAAA